MPAFLRKKKSQSTLAQPIGFFIRCTRCYGCVRAHDKLKETGLTPPPGEKVKVPLIKECEDHLECKLCARSKCATGDHTIFVGEIV